MKKSNVLLITILAIIVTLMIGYALFSETITVTGTATAKGNFDIKVTNVDAAKMDEFWGYKDIGIISASNININDNVVTTNVTLGAPGSTKYFIIKVENTGTIPAYLKSVTDENNKAYEVGITSYFAGKQVQNSEGTTWLYADMTPEGSYDSDYEDEYWGFFDNTINVSFLKDYVLDPGESTYYLFEYGWSSHSTSQEQLSISFTAKLNWEQVTAN